MADKRKVGAKKMSKKENSNTQQSSNAPSPKIPEELRKIFLQEIEDEKERSSAAAAIRMEIDLEL